MGGIITSIFSCQLEDAILYPIFSPIRGDTEGVKIKELGNPLWSPYEGDKWV